MKAQTILLTFVMALAMAASTAYAADNQVARQDAQWLKNTHQVNLAAIKAAKAAKKQGNSALVDKIARKIMADDQALDKKVATLAEDLGVDLPDSPSTKMKSTLETVKLTSATTFDKLWTKTMLKAEIKAANTTQKEVAKGKSHKVKKLAEAALPALNLQTNMLQHAMTKLKMPETIQASK